MNPKPLISRSVAETQNIAQTLLTNWRGGEVVFLVGGLGSGKTAFTQGIAKALHITRPVQSPTFVLVREYAVPKKQPGPIRRVIHIDAYRFRSARELLDLGWSDFAGQPDTLTFVENPGVLGETIIPDTTITFTVVTPSTRDISIAHAT